MLEDPEAGEEGLRGLAAAGLEAVVSPWTPASKAACSSGDAATTRPSSHSAIDGAAESTSPTPAMRTMSRSGRPTATLTPWMMPSGTVAM